MFNGEVEKGDEEEAWLLGMKKYFQIYNYSDRIKAIMAIYNHKISYLTASYKRGKKYEKEVINLESF